jgi:hypothetical protein
MHEISIEAGLMLPDKIANDMCNHYEHPRLLAQHARRV